MPAWAQEWGWRLIVVGLIRTLPWKAIALWRAARRGQTGWVVALVLVHTLGVLEILYLFVFSHRRAAHAARHPETKNTHPPTPIGPITRFP
jgi:methionyl-tRNA synthetase